MPDSFDFEAAAASHRRRPGIRCTACIWLDRLDSEYPDVAPGVRRAILNLAIPVSGILAEAARRGLPALACDDPDQAIKRHRSKGHERLAAA